LPYQANAFGDVAMLVTELTQQLGTMRLINSRFARENKFFWDERANTLELQTTQPIQNHIEMGLVEH
jgi:cytochrome c peroxidase